MAISDDELLEAAMDGKTIDDVAKEKKAAKAKKEKEEPEVAEAEAKPVNAASQYLGQQLNHKPGDSPFAKDDDKTLAERKGLSKIGEKIGANDEVREGWIPVDRQYLGDRDIYYPEGWKFRIRPASVEAIRAWSTLDDEDVNSMDDVFNEVLKSCLSIVDENGAPKPWGNIASWDRFFWLLLIREFTFVDGETKIKYEEDCTECDNPITFELTSQSLMFETPDPELLPMYDRENRCWHIDPAEYDIEGEDPITLYIPTLEKDANIKAWLINRIQQNRNRKVDNVFLRFALWMSPKVSKDLTIAQRQMKEMEMKYKAWDVTMFDFMDEVLNNIIVTGSTKLTVTCPICGEEVTSDIRFPNSVRDLFHVQGRRKKFGKK